MATLQNIRSKGPLLVIVIGLALFAFIAGDAWKVMQPHQAHDVGATKYGVPTLITNWLRKKQKHWD